MSLAMIACPYESLLVWRGLGWRDRWSINAGLERTDWCVRALFVSSSTAGMPCAVRLQLLEYLHEMLTDIDGVALLDVDDSIECVADEEDGERTGGELHLLADLLEYSTL